MADKLLEIPLDQISEGERFRKEYDLDDLAESIQEKGVLQPITVCEREGKYLLMAGGRRFAACKKLGMPSIPCLVREIEGDLDLREIEYVENAYRKDLTWQERMHLVVEIHGLMKTKFGSGWNQRKTAQKLERSVGGINRLIQLSEMIKKFPDISKEQTEDNAVKKARKILEAITVQALVKKHEAEAKSLGVGAPLGAAPGGPAQTKDGKPMSDFERRARYAGDHFNIGDALVEMDAIINDPDLNPPISLVEVDPPYGIDLKTQKKGDLTRELDKYNEVEADAYEAFTDCVVSRIVAITPANTRIIYWFAMDYYATITEAFDRHGLSYDPIPGIWVKPSGQTNAPELYLARTYETFLIAWKGEGVPLRQRGRSNVFSFAPEAAARKYHPTQRPVGLMREILKTFGWPGGIVLVPFLGSGATLRAAYAEGMSAFGWELNADNKPKFLAAVEQDIEEHYNSQQDADEDDEQSDSDDSDFDYDEEDDGPPF